MTYSTQFYRNLRDGSLCSAREVIPLLLELIQPSSVIDVGCGVGTWLAVFSEYGIRDIWGVDGGYVDPSLLEIPVERFLAADLEKPLRLDRKFDLAISLEVGEHLPSEYASLYIETLTNLSPVILFSAAIPFQGGQNHVNEQWPEYWADLFRRRRYVPVDLLRKRIWENPRVDWWYAQNILMFLNEEALSDYGLLADESRNTPQSPLRLVHPAKYLEMVKERQRLELLSRDLAEIVPQGDAFVLVDEEQLRGMISTGRSSLRFLERDGQYWGPPPDDVTAINELDRLRRKGASFIIFAWPAFWWLEHYAEFAQHLGSNFRCVLKNDRLVAFDLRL
jgi:SAM-dependent methyltransferase